MARKKSYTVRCDGDGCGKLAEVEDENFMPEGWIQIRVPNDMGRLPNSGFDLCSLKCVGKWARGRSEVLNGKGKATVHRYPCPSCGDEVAPQGFQHHFRTQHPEDDYDTALEIYKTSSKVSDENA